MCLLAGVSAGLYNTVRTLRNRSGGGAAPYGWLSGGGTSLGGDPAAPIDDVDTTRRTALVRAAERVGPATVWVSVTKTRTVQTGADTGSQDDFIRRYFRGYFPGTTYEQLYESYGSGVIIDPDGYVLTMHHVVGGASEVTVTLADGRELAGRVLGSDPRYDLAVVKVEGENLPIASIGNSDDIMVGEWVVAIGNPFSELLEDPQPTVTAGVVSALHRDVPIEGSRAVYKDMIQTDAAINPGNSGGPLVNSRGEVIGINAFVFSSTGTYQGTGFAVPINTARLIINELIEYGRVRDVWLGVKVSNITPTIAVRLGMSDTRGALASYVEPDSPADRAGIRPGDIVVAVNGEEVEDVRETRRAIFGSRVGDPITLTLLRLGERMDVVMKLEEVPR